MDYERIHKVQMGAISPTKLRMKLLGARNNRKEEGGSNSSRASPSKHEDLKNAKNSLLSHDLDEEANSNDWKGASAPQAITSFEDSVLEYSKELPVDGHGNQVQSSRKDLPTKEKSDNIRNRNQNTSVGASYQIQPGGNSSTVHPVRSQEEDGNDSGHENGSTSSFEFHRGERTLQNQMVGPFFRHVPSKWNDAEKWIVNRQMINHNLMKRTLRNQGTRQVIPNWGRIPPESMTTDQKQYVNLVGETKMVDSTNFSSQSVVEKFSFEPNSFQKNPLPANATNIVFRLQEESNHKEECVSEAPTAETTVNPTIHSVSMRDVGTEMTPIPSQDPSRTGTPIGTTPSFSPMSSMPSTPKREAPVPSPADGESECRDKRCKTNASEREMQIKTRREIAALGLQLGKMNIASWASQAEAEPPTPSHKTLEADQLVKAEYVARAAAWEDAEKSKHTDRYKREELKIQAWEGHLKAKFQAQMRETEVQAERMIARAQNKTAQKLALARQLVEEKIAAAEARRNNRAAKTTQQVERIRQTGRVPSRFRCCSWFL